MISPDLVFLLVAGLAFLGFVLDALFDRLRIASILPLMLIGMGMLYFHIIPAGALDLLHTLLPYLSALTVAFILFHVGLQIRFDALREVLGRSLGFTFAVQLSTAAALSLLAYFTFGWGLIISLVFGFGLSGPSTASVPVLVRVARMPKALGTSLLFESVLTDLLELLVPILLLGLLASGNFSIANIGGALALSLAGSALVGVFAAIAWLWILDRIGPVARAYSWTLTITMVLATYGFADYIHLNAAMTIFVFGLMLANRRHLEFDPFQFVERDPSASARSIHALRRLLRLSAAGVDIEHIQQVQKEVSFFASAFFFVYIGLLFQVSTFTDLIALVPLAAAFVMLAVRFAGSPILAVYFSREPTARRSERALVSFNLARGLSPAIVATLPLAYGIVIPGFLDAMFLGILFSTVASTAGIFAFYSPNSGHEAAEVPGSEAGPAEDFGGGPPDPPPAPEAPPREPPPLPAPRRDRGASRRE